MKTLALIAAALSLSGGAAFAECSYHQTTAALKSDRPVMTASIVADMKPAVAEAEVAVLLKKPGPHEQHAALTE